MCSCVQWTPDELRLVWSSLSEVPLDVALPSTYVCICICTWLPIYSDINALACMGYIDFASYIIIRLRLCFCVNKLCHTLNFVRASPNAYEDILWGHKGIKTIHAKSIVSQLYLNQTSSFSAPHISFFKIHSTTKQHRWTKHIKINIHVSIRFRWSVALATKGQNTSAESMFTSEYQWHYGFIPSNHREVQATH